MWKNGFHCSFAIYLFQIAWKTTSWECKKCICDIREFLWNSRVSFGHFFQIANSICAIWRVMEMWLLKAYLRMFSNFDQCSLSISFKFMCFRICLTHEMCLTCTFTPVRITSNRTKQWPWHLGNSGFSNFDLHYICIFCIKDLIDH